MELRSSEKPNMVQHGGGQMLAVNQFPSGNVSIQNFGSTYRDIVWDGWFEGADAMDRMYQIGGMRQKGEPVLFTTEAYTQNVIIAEFQADHRTNFYIPFSITLKRIVQITKETEKDAVDKTAQKILEEVKANIDKIRESKKYVVKDGDTLSAISKQIYGDANQWDKLYEANKDILVNGPHRIKPGQELIIA